MSGKIFYINLAQNASGKNQNNAGAKAPNDISQICAEEGMEEFRIPAFPDGKNKVYQKLWLLMVCSMWWMKLRWKVHEKDKVVFQYPLYGVRIAARMVSYIKKKTGCQFVVVIHDLNTLREGIHGYGKDISKRNSIEENILLPQFDAIICHNNHMKDYLIRQGFDANKIVSLKIFDYLCDCCRVKVPRNELHSIAIAGNLAINKCPYIYKIFGNDGLQNPNLTVHLYGNNYNIEKAQDNIFYHGSFSPEDLPKHLEGDFGLVWDGISAETCAGNTGEYLRFNNPHKTSLYLASGMPVIVWKQAAIADFVLENGVGIAVDSLYGLDQVIENISDEEYQKMCANANQIGEKLRSGYYFKSAFEKCLEIID